jgi:flagellar assembly factor FliW
MKILSKHFGEIEIQEDHIITFPKGLIGLEDNKRYVLIEFEENSMVYWLQSIEDPDLCFIVANPYSFKSDYVLDVYEDDLKLIEMDDEKNVMVLVILNVSLETKKITANLLGPLVINTNKNLGVQAVSKVADYSTRYDITLSVGE